MQPSCGLRVAFVWPSCGLRVWPSCGMFVVNHFACSTTSSTPALAASSNGGDGLDASHAAVLVAFCTSAMLGACTSSAVPAQPLMRAATAAVSSDSVTATRSAAQLATATTSRLQQGHTGAQPSVHWNVAQEWQQCSHGLNPTRELRRTAERRKRLP